MDQQSPLNSRKTSSSDGPFDEFNQETRNLRREAFEKIQACKDLKDAIGCLTDDFIAFADGPSNPLRFLSNSGLFGDKPIFKGSSLNLELNDLYANDSSISAYERLKTNSSSPELFAVEFMRYAEHIKMSVEKLERSSISSPADTQTEMFLGGIPTLSKIKEFRGDQSRKPSDMQPDTQSSSLKNKQFE